MQLAKNILLIIDSIIQILILIFHFISLWQAIFYDD